MKNYIKDFLHKCYDFSALSQAPYRSAPYYIDRLLRKIFCKTDVLKQKIDHSFPNVAVFGGIGDVCWSFVLIDCILKKFNVKKINIILHDPAPSHATSKRSLDMLKRFSFVHTVLPVNFEIHPFNVVDSDTGCYNYIAAGSTIFSSKTPFEYSLCINGYLERGDSFTEICKKLNLDESLINYNFFDYYVEKIEDTKIANDLLINNNCGYVVFYLGPLSGNTVEGFNKDEFWKAQDWISLGKQIHAVTGLKIVLTGALYDVEYFMKVLASSSSFDFDIFINMIGVCSLPQTISLLKRASLVIGYPSGIPIMSTYLGTKTAMFWRPQDLSISSFFSKLGFTKNFATCWVPPCTLKNGAYIDLWYSIDNASTAFAKFEAKGWMQSLKAPCTTATRDIYTFVPTPESQIVDYILNIMTHTEIKTVSYLDIGSHGPITSNNTYFFYLKGLRGVLVEPNKKYADLCKLCRPLDTVLQLGVSYDGSKSARYYEFDLHDGCNTISEEWKELALSKGIKIKDEYEIELIDINELIEKYFGGNCPQIVFIDAEGVDFFILEKLNFEKYKPIIIVLETNKEEFDDSCENEIVIFLNKVGYRYIASTVANMIFLLKSDFTTTKMIWHTQC